MSRHLTDKEEAEDRSEKLFFNWAEERPAKFGIVFENELNRDLLSSRQINYQQQSRSAVALNVMDLPLPLKIVTKNSFWAWK